MDIHELPPYSYTWKTCEDSEGFEAKCVEMPDLSAYGDTPAEALEEIQVAVCAWLEVLTQDSLPLPTPLRPPWQLAQTTDSVGQLLTSGSGQPLASHSVPSSHSNLERTAETMGVVA